MPEAGPRLLLCLTARIPREGVARFQAYEDQVLPLLAAHGGRLERRLRNGDGTIEVHLVSFESRSAFESFRADPRRAAVAGLLADSGAASDLVEVEDVS